MQMKQGTLAVDSCDVSRALHDAKGHQTWVAAASGRGYDGDHGHGPSGLKENDLEIQNLGKISLRTLAVQMIVRCYY